MRHCHGIEVDAGAALLSLALQLSLAANRLSRWQLTSAVQRVPGHPPSMYHRTEIDQPSRTQDEPLGAECISFTQT